MPRLKKGQTERRRCAQACESCRRRKEKCDAQHPCGGCVKRSIECNFVPNSPSLRSLPRSAPDSSYYNSTDPAAKRRKIFHLNDSVDSSDAEIAIDSCLNTDRSQLAIPESSHGNWQFKTQFEESPPEAPVPRVSRLLRDGRGKFIYIGDSASLSFLQNVRRIVLGIIGECDLTRDRLRHSFLEQVPSGHSSESQAALLVNLSNGQDSILNKDDTEMLANHYLTATACLLDLFETDILFQSLIDWRTDPPQNTEIGTPILYLVLAIGAQVKAENGWTDIADRCFARGRALAFISYTDEPSLQTVQSFILISMYLLGNTRRNAAFMNLGFAVRAAHALGLHRRDIQTLFSESERQARKRTWQSLRVVDLFLSASLGRPSATSDFEKDFMKGTVTERASSSTDESFSSSILGLISIFERILNEVYRKRTITTQLADDISRQYREWTAQLPSLPADLRNKPSNEHATELAQKIASAHLTGAYHWSIILLTRPFLMLQVSLHHKRNNTHAVMPRNRPPTVPAILAYAEASIDSAIRGLDIADNLICCDGLPKRLPFLTNSIFNYALAIGVAFFGDFDRSYPLVDGMEKALRILAHSSPHEPQARRYAEIIGYLNKAAKDYVNQRDRESMQKRRKRQNDLFGTIGHNIPQSSTSPSGDSPTSVSTTRARGAPNTHYTLNTPRDSNSGTSDKQPTGPHLTSQSPSDRAERGLDLNSAGFATLSTSGVFISGSEDQNISEGNYQPSVPLGFQDAMLWDTFGDETMNLDEMMPMFNLFSEMAPTSPFDAL